jgi:hypothetical protein
LCEKYLSEVVDADNFDSILDICDGFDLKLLRAVLTKWLMQHCQSISSISEKQLQMLTFKTGRSSKTASASSTTADSRFSSVPVVEQQPEPMLQD